ncbi:MAG: type II toxin-antitoxin system RelE/ParE family toxin [Nitrospirota bacterium]|nr:type II toxin-antitoxin system RelE/ParE family toxin [Nitrospirota bacterium]
MLVAWLAEAVEDLIGIRQYIAHNNPRAAEDVAQRILGTIDYLRDHPGIGKAGKLHGTRELVIPALPYIVPYRVRAEVIEILGVLHTSRQRPRINNQKQP